MPTRPTLVHIRPHQSVRIGESDREDLVAAVDEGAVSAQIDPGKEQLLHSGGFLWVGHGDKTQVLTNKSGSDVRHVTFAFKP